MHEESRKWIAKGDRDLGTAGFALNSADGPLPVTTALHCQAAAENYLRAFLHVEQTNLAEHGNLNSLFENCLAIDGTFVSIRADVEKLSGYAIASRYPKAEESLEFRKDAITTVQHVREFILGRLT